MIFNSIDFAIFLPLVFLVYWFVVKGNLKIQNAFLLIVSYVFYGWWDYRFLSLIALSSLIDYLIGIKLGESYNPRNRKVLLGLSIFVNLGFLGFFKYYNFFTDSFADAFSLLGTAIDPQRLDIVLPVGISFYTFQTLSYSIDVYRKKLDPTKDIVAFFAFVSFFPQLVAGPIERATNLLPQFQTIRSFDYSKAVDGMRQILWGLFKKVVIADNCAEYANQIFDNYSGFGGSTLALGAVFFTFQIYGDFSGYSDIAIGTSRLFGFDLKRNFAFPYFSRDIAEFWRRWHMSLSTWFRDYLYIPLGGSKGSIANKVRNTFIIFIVSGFWHGANWTFIFWGFLNALYFLPLLISNSNRNNIATVAEGNLFPKLREFLGIIITFALTVIAWIFFRSNSIGEAFEYLFGIFSISFFEVPKIISIKMIIVMSFMIFMIVLEWYQRHKEHGLELTTAKTSAFARWFLYIFLIYCIIWLGGKQQEFIYFQF